MGKTQPPSNQRDGSEPSKPAKMALLASVAGRSPLPTPPTAGQLVQTPTGDSTQQRDQPGSPVLPTHAPSLPQSHNTRRPNTFPSRGRATRDRSLHASRFNEQTLKRITFACVAICVATVGLSAVFKDDQPPSQFDPTNATVTKVVDGDTINAVIAHKVETIRLIGIDTPETVHPTKPVGCFGREASDFTKSQLPPNTAIRLVLDVEARDKYGRVLAYVYRTSDNAFINLELARRGYAQLLTIAPNVAHSQDFIDATRAARNENRGLWERCRGELKK